MVFTPEQKIFMIESYFRNGQQGENGTWVYQMAPAFQEFTEKFPNVAVLYEQFSETLRYTVRTFRDSGSVQRKPGSSRPKVRTEENIQNVQHRMEDEPQLSLRRLSQQTELSVSTCQRIVRKDLGLYPYKVQVYQELLPPDYNQRVAYCNWFNNFINNDETLDLTFYTDEAWFHLTGFINSQTMRMWSADNPHFFRETPLHPLKIGVWVGMSRRRLIGPIFFEDSVTAERYRNNILDVFINQLHDDELTHGYFQQDGATAHTARETLRYLRQFFGDRLISRDLWPARSPDLTPLDYYLFPHLKNTIFKEPVHTIDDLKIRIREECERVTPETLVRVFENMKRRVTMCIEAQGYHFQQLL
jgi:hypothetical protein